MRWCAPFGGSGRAFHTAVCFEAPAPTGAGTTAGEALMTEDAVSDLIFIFGGRTSGGALTSSLHMIDAADMRWTSLSEVVTGTRRTRSYTLVHAFQTPFLSFWR